MVDKVAQPAFTLHYNGCDIQGKERMGEQLGVILQVQIPEFMRALGRTIQESGMDYDSWNAANPEGVKELAKGYLA